MSQFRIGKSTLNDILRSEGKFKAEKEELRLSGLSFLLRNEKTLSNKLSFVLFLKRNLNPGHDVKLFWCMT